MNINGMGPSFALPGMGMNGAAPRVRQQADEAVARKMMPAAVAENAARASTEAKGMFVDTYA